MNFERRQALFAAFGSVFPLSTLAQSAPQSTPIRIVVSYPAGGPSDIVARILAKKMQDNMNNIVLVENNPGANGLIAGRKISKAKADGSELLLATTANSSNPFIYKNMPFDTANDFTQIAMISSGPVVLWASKKSGITSLKDLLTKAKSNPGKLTFGSSGIGGTPHLAGEMLKQFTGIDILHVPFQGSAPLITELVAGRIDLYFGGVTSTLQHYKEGNLLPLATAEPERSDFIPEVPTFLENGISGFQFLSWFGLFGPAGMSGNTVETLAKAITPLSSDNEFRGKLKTVGMVPRIMIGKEFREYFLKDIKMWGKIIHDAGIKPT